MLSIQVLREQTDEVRTACAARGVDAPIDRILELDEQRRALLGDVERMRADRNQAGKLIGAAKDDAERQRLIEEQRAVAGELDGLEERLRQTDEELTDLLLTVPNLYHPSLPEGEYEDSVIVIEGDGSTGEEQRVVPPRSLRGEGEPEQATGKPHWELGEELGIIDFERATKVSGAHFYILRNEGARLQRALISWMLDVHREQGYREVYPPVIVSSDALVGTGNLPKFGETMFKLEDTDLWLIPTAEVPVTNMYRDEIIDVPELPIHHTAYSASFRREQFSAGRENRGIKRVYQFDKVEMVRFVEPETSWDALDQLLEDSLAIVRALGFRYRVIRLATGDLTFSSAMTYDIEVWAPGAAEWLEVASISNFADFQARRASLRYRDSKGQAHHLHTLNGSGLALPRTFAALLEQNQREDGSVEVPEVLHSYLGGLELIEAQS
ncbi:MAG TPA: serine--tRNA ligase [Dehalococcoidia bacterium]|jgi:seryl-tRNA synthetase|nr:serine--tRNA ligase [Dehalococcoidia bacterium]